MKPAHVEVTGPELGAVVATVEWAQAQLRRPLTREEWAQVWLQAFSAVVSRRPPVLRSVT